MSKKTSRNISIFAGIIVALACVGTLGLVIGGIVFVVFLFAVSK